MISIINRKNISFFIMSISIIAIVSYLLYERQITKLLFNMSLTYLLPLLFMNALVIGTNGIFIKIFLHKNGCNLRIMEWYGLSAVTSMGNYLSFLSGGMLIRAAYLKHRFSFPYSFFVAMMAATYLMNYLTISILGMLMTVSSFATKSNTIYLFFFFCATVTLILLLLAIPIGKLSARSKIVSFINLAIDSFQRIENDRFLISKLICLSVINILVGSFIYYISFKAIGRPVSFHYSLLIYLITSFSVLLNLTPSNLGIQELFSILSCSFLGIDIDGGVLVALIVRATAMLTIFALGLPFSLYFANRLSLKSSTTN